MSATVFGLTPEIRLARQLTRVATKGAAGLSVKTGVVVDTPALAFLIGGPARVITDAAGQSLLSWSPDGGTGPAAVAGSFDFSAGALKKRETFHAFDLARTPARVAETTFYFASYKGVTDLVTKYVWPWPALFVTRACAAAGITPNMVTALSILLSIAAIPLLMAGQFAAGLACAWGMTFLDTVDGKLARVTVSYSKFGNYFDHIPDLLFPPVWWWAFAWGLPADSQRWPAFGVILATYLVGRLCEGVFELRNGFVPFVWRRFDARFRLVLARRNPNLLILTGGVLIGQAVAGYVAVAAWCVVCAVVQVVALVQSEMQRPLRSFLA